ncbi:MAG: hypothetical protein ABGZ53_31040 [Fuerstiella sp.]
MASDEAKAWSKDKEKACDYIRIATGALESILRQEGLGHDPPNFEGMWIARSQVLILALEFWEASGGFKYETSVFDDVMEFLHERPQELAFRPLENPLVLKLLDPIYAENLRLKHWIDETVAPYLGLRITNEEARIVQRDGKRFRDKPATLTPTTFDLFKKLFSYGDSGLTKEQAENFAGCSGAPLRKTVQRIRESLHNLDVTVKEYRLVERDAES